MTGNNQAALKKLIERLQEYSWEDSQDQQMVQSAVRELLTPMAKVVPYLDASGWIESVKSKRPVDANGGPLPWYTYPAIHYLKKLDLTSLNVFEFGSGSSTLWWASKAKHVCSVEHHSGWAQEMKPILPSNVVYMYKELCEDGEYSRAAINADMKYDVIVNDGRDRVNCMKNSLGSLSECGVVIWDNAERQRYREGYALLYDAGFRRIDFIGHGPINGGEWNTSVFYRNDNVFNI